jgi:hypothetical protein
MSLEDQVGAMQLGDSGGPWYISTTAVGVFQGWCPLADGLQRLSFTKMWHSYDALGITTLLAP